MVNKLNEDLQRNQYKMCWQHDAKFQPYTLYVDRKWKINELATDFFTTNMYSFDATNMIYLT